MKKNLFIVSILLLVGVLVACSSVQARPDGAQSGRPARPGGAGVPGAAGGPGASSATGGQENGTPQPLEIPLESKVGIGILKLEGTDQAVDEAKAEEILPLFKALKVLSTDTNTAVAEITALNTQIKNSMTADQLKAVEEMDITAADLRTLMESYGTTSSASSNSSRTSNSGGMGVPGGMPGGGMMGVMVAAEQSNETTQATPNAITSLANSRTSAGGYNLTFVDPIIKLLQSKISE